MTAAAELLPWLQVLLLPMLPLLLGIKADLAALRATQQAHDHRLTQLERIRT